MSLKSVFYANKGRDKNLLTTLVVPIGVLFQPAYMPRRERKKRSENRNWGGTGMHGKSDNDILIPENRSTLSRRNVIVYSAINLFRAHFHLATQ